VLAGIGNYLLWWEIIPVFLAIAAWIFGGSYLLRRCCRAWAPSKRLTVARSTQVVFLAGLSGGVAAVALYWLARSLGERLETDLTWVGLALAALAALVAAYTVIYTLLGLSAAQTVKIMLPALAGVVLSVAVLAGASVPLAYHQGRARLGRRLCTARLRYLYQVLEEYRARHGALPENLAELARANLLAKDHLRCPANRQAEVGYFYRRPPPGAAVAGRRIVLCDLRANHSDSRGVLFSNGDWERYSEAEFRKLLQSRENADFARALAEAERR